MKKIAVYGGSFDPVHTGHTLIASKVAALPDIDEVWLMVSPENPFKSGRHLAPENDRLAMVRLAAADLPGVEACDFEFSLPRPSYTYDTLCRLREAFPDCEFTLVIGADNWRDFSGWRNPDNILSEFGLIIYPRPGIPLDIPDNDHITVVPDATQSEASSTEVRRRLAIDAPTDGLITPAVRAYIGTHGLYQPTSLT